MVTATGDTGASALCTEHGNNISQIAGGSKKYAILHFMSLSTLTFIK